MSKFIVAIIILLSLVPFIIFLFFGKEKIEEPIDIESVIKKGNVSTEARPGDSPSCATCRQISDSGSQEQCLKDFACTP